MNCPNELFDSPADKIYLERVERIRLVFEAAPNSFKLTLWEVDFVEDLYWYPRESYTDKQKAIINRIMSKLGID